MTTPYLIFGAYGIFGGHVTHTLAKEQTPLIIAGRNLPKAQTLAKSLHGKTEAVQADLNQPETYRPLLQKRKPVVINCAGPFSNFNHTLLETCLEEGCSYVDIADDRDYCQHVLNFKTNFETKSLSAVYGCSSLPAISGALAEKIYQQNPTPPKAVRVTLFIGNKNPKGEGAIQSAVEILGKPIQAPQGTLFGFRDREIVPLPPPFGKRGVYNFESPEYDLFPKLVNTSEVRVKVGFELGLATRTFALLATLSSRYGRRTGKWMVRLGKFAPPLGCSGGAVMTEFFYADQSTHFACISSSTQGQLMAAFPCALVAKALKTKAEQNTPKGGVFTAYEFLGASPLIEALIQEGFEYSSSF